MENTKFHPKELGFRIKTAREAAGYKQPEFAALLNVGIRTLANYENGQTDISVAQLFKVSEILKIEPAQLLQLDKGNIVNSFNNVHEQAFMNGGGVGNKVEMSRDWMEAMVKRYEFLEQQITLKDQRIAQLEA